MIFPTSYILTLLFLLIIPVLSAPINLPVAHLNSRHANLETPLVMSQNTPHPHEYWPVYRHHSLKRRSFEDVASSFEKRGLERQTHIMHRRSFLSKLKVSDWSLCDPVNVLTPAAERWERYQEERYKNRLEGCQLGQKEHP